MEFKNCNRVLSIQSHVVSGYVGNKSACFPLQVLGFEVDAINSVQLSNHTGYKYWKGQVLNAEDLENLYQGLKLNDLHHYSHILTGYVGTASFLSKVVEVVKELKTQNPNICFVCDPVMGDNGKMYVPEDILPLYRDHLVPLADIITPNQFETELLTGITIKCEEDAMQAMHCLHNKGAKTVVISSANLGSPDILTLLGSCIKGEEKTCIKMTVPLLPATFFGTGDLFAALLLAWMAKTDNLKISCEMAINTLQNVLMRTINCAKTENKDGVLSSKQLEIKLIQSKNDIEKPPANFSAVLL